MNATVFRSSFRMSISALLLAATALGATIPSTSPGPASAARVETSRLVAIAQSPVVQQDDWQPRVPSVSALKLDATGRPVARINAHFGLDFGMDRDALVDLLAGFSPSDGEEAAQERRGHDVDPWSLVVLPEPVALPEPPEFTIVDPQNDLIVEFKSIHDDSIQALTCTNPGGAIYWNASLSSNTNYILLFENNSQSTTSDMICVAAGPNKSSSANPNLYLDQNVAGEWYLVTSSSSSSLIDMVRGYSGSCKSIKWRVRLNMLQGGSISARAVRFSAS